MKIDNTFQSLTESLKLVFDKKFILQKLGTYKQRRNQEESNSGVRTTPWNRIYGN